MFQSIPWLGLLCMHHFSWISKVISKDLCSLLLGLVPLKTLSECVSHFFSFRLYCIFSDFNCFHTKSAWGSLGSCLWRGIWISFLFLIMIPVWSPHFGDSVCGSPSDLWGWPCRSADNALLSILLLATIQLGRLFSSGERLTSKCSQVKEHLAALGGSMRWWLRLGLLLCVTSDTAVSLWPRSGGWRSRSKSQA